MSSLWLALRWLHVLTMAFFVGGQLLLAVAVAVAVVRSPAAPAKLRLLAYVSQARFFYPPATRVAKKSGQYGCDHR